MSQNGVRVHVWTVEDRSLCDAKGRAQAVDMTGDEPACGACVLVAEELLARAKALIWQFGQPDEPPEVAVRVLGGTRWGDRFGLDRLIDEVSGPTATYTYPSFSDGPAATKEERP